MANGPVATTYTSQILKKLVTLEFKGLETAIKFKCLFALLFQTGGVLMKSSTVLKEKMLRERLVLF